MVELFAESNLIGTFKGFTERGYDFSAEIVAPYKGSMNERPQLGQFVLIKLENEEEASLGRITKFVPSGLLASVEGEDYMNTMQRRNQPVAEDLKESKLKYRVEIKLLGAIKVINGEISFVPSQRRLPHLGAKVAFPSDLVLKEICSLGVKNDEVKGDTNLGNYALGEFVYSGNRQSDDSIFRYVEPDLKVKFNINNLVAKRTVVFARAGYGKSNLIKYLISELYKDDGKNAVTSKGSKVGTLIFDADGEYFWPDNKGRPGFCDVPHLKDRIVLFTNREAPNQHYAQWKAGEVKLDIRNLSPGDVIGMAVSADRQTQQNVLKLKSSYKRWRDIVDLVHNRKLQTPNSELGKLMGYEDDAQAAAEINAAKSNMSNVVERLHDPDSQLISDTYEALKQGYIVIIDISLLNTTTGNHIAGILMRDIFKTSQKKFTGRSSPIPVNVVIEEAQSVLGRRLAEDSPFVEWVKEGRKYDLGAILITQQPGSMAPEIMSQSDNWFSFHLLSEGDAYTLGKYNSHFSPDILSHIIGEPIRGNCYMWSAPHQPFVLPVRIRNFEQLYREHIRREEDRAVKDADQQTAYKKEAEGQKPKGIFKALNIGRLRGGKESRDKELAKKLAEIIKRKTLKPLQFDKENLTGIYRGHLYFLVREALEAFPDEIRKEDELYMPLLRLLFDEKPVIRKGKRSTDKEEQEFYCVSKRAWDKAMKK